MAYIGNTPAENYGNLTVQHFTVTATAAYVLDTAAANENEIALFINNVRQQPGASYAYTVSGTALTLSAATAATDTMYCLFLGKAQHTSVPTIANGSITNAMLVSIAASKLTGTIDNARISLDAAEIPNLDASKITTGTIIDARLPSTALNSNIDLTTLSATNLTTGTVAEARLATLAANKLTGTIIAQGDGSSTDGKITLNCSQNTHGVSIQSPAHVTNSSYTLTLPTTDGNADEVLKTDGAGVLSWTTQASGALDSPVITGTLSVLSGGSVSHTVANWSDDVSYTIVPTNCTVGAVNGSGVFVVTHTSGVPFYTIKATTDSLGLADSAVVTKNITITLTAPTLSSPADVGTAIDVVYTITSTDTGDDKLILDPGTANFTYQSESGPGTASKVGNTVECVGFGTGNPVVTIQFTVQATYSVTATAVKIDGSFGTSAASSADSITIANRALTAPAISSPADVGTATDVTYTITSNDAEDNKLILNIGSSNFTLVSVTPGAGSIVGNTVEVTGFTTNNPAVVIQYTAEATYSVTATAVDTTGYYGTSASSSADSITIANYVGMVANGGEVSAGTIDGDYKYHRFISGTSNFQITTLGDDAVIEYLVVAGGGGGGCSGTGGGAGAGAGGAGGLLYGTNLTVTAATFTAVVGAGGPGATGSTYLSGAKGDTSSFSGGSISTLTATGGGFGAGGYSSYITPGSGGSGGGGGHSVTAGGTGIGGQGNNGGATISYTSPYGGGGGGGHSAAGQNSISGNVGNGGAGTNYSITGSPVGYAGGGGGGGTSSAYGSASHGGGVGGSSNTNGTGGVINTGGGGGGSGSFAIAGNGGSGIIVIRYKFQ
jgi:hypothetical protein